jgi:hypothetical protein
MHHMFSSHHANEESAWLQAYEKVTSGDYDQAIVTVYVNKHDGSATGRVELGRAYRNRSL